MKLLLFISLTFIISPLVLSALDSRKLASRPMSDGWRQGAGCIMKDDNLAIILLLSKNTDVSRDYAAIYSILWSKDGTKIGTTTTSIEPAESLDDLKNAAIVCLSSGGYAVIHQIGTAVTVSFFNSNGDLTNQITRTNFYDVSGVYATSAGGFLLTSIKDDEDNNIVEIFNADGTSRATITLDVGESTKVFGSRAANGEIVLSIVAEGEPILIKFYDLDGVKSGNDVEVTTTQTLPDTLTATLNGGNLVVMDYAKDWQNIDTFKPKLYDSKGSFIKNIMTVEDVSLYLYSLIALQDGGFAIGWQTYDVEEAYFRTFDADGTSRMSAKLIECTRGTFLMSYSDGSFLTIWYLEGDDDTQNIYGARFDPYGTNIGFGDECSTCPAVVEPKSYFVATITYNIPYDQFIDGNGEAIFIQQLMNVLGVEIDQIVIISITSGSTIVNFKIIESTEDNAVSVDELKTQLDTAVQKDQMIVLDAEVKSYEVDDIVTGEANIKIALLSILLVIVAIIF